MDNSNGDVSQESSRSHDHEAKQVDQTQLILVIPEDGYGSEHGPQSVAVNEEENAHFILPQTAQEKKESGFFSAIQYFFSFNWFTSFFGFNLTIEQELQKISAKEKKVRDHLESRQNDFLGKIRTLDDEYRKALHIKKEMKKVPIEWNEEPEAVDQKAKPKTKKERKTILLENKVAAAGKFFRLLRRVGDKTNAETDKKNEMNFESMLFDNSVPTLQDPKNDQKSDPWDETDTKILGSSAMINFGSEDVPENGVTYWKKLLDAYQQSNNDVDKQTLVTGAIDKVGRIHQKLRDEKKAIENPSNQEEEKKSNPGVQLSPKMKDIQYDNLSQVDQKLKNTNFLCCIPVGHPMFLKYLMSTTIISILEDKNNQPEELVKACEDKNLEKLFVCIQVLADQNKGLNLIQTCESQKGKIHDAVHQGRMGRYYHQYKKYYDKAQEELMKLKEKQEEINKKRAPRMNMA